MNSEQQKQYYDITQHEIEALRTTYNMADAHTHQQQSPTQREIVSRLPELWYESENTTQYELEQRFIENFFRLHQQPTILQKRKDKVLLVYAASISMAITSTYFRKKGLSVTLIDPCFDNLHDIMKHMEVPLAPIEEEILHDLPNLYDNLCKHVHGDVLFLVDPNNPTGFSLLNYGEDAFAQVLRFCKEKNKILAMDLCFAAFSMMDENCGRFDIYKMLEKSGITYIMMEDTGKTWPVQDAKCALYTTSDDIFSEIYDIHTAFLLNVSPFILSVLSEYLCDSMRDNFASVKNVLEQNRLVAIRELEGTCLEYCVPVTKVSVGWFKIKDPALKATELQRLAYEQELYVLPGTYFYWSRPEQGERYIRIALARRPDLFEAGIKRLKALLNDISSNIS